MNDILQVEGLHKNYPAFSLNDIHFTLPTGLVMGFYWPKRRRQNHHHEAYFADGAKRQRPGAVYGRPCERQSKQQIGVVFDSSFLLDDWKVAGY